MLVRIPHPGEVWKARPRRSKKKSAVLKKLEKYLVDEQGEPIKKLCRLWDDQKQALQRDTASCPEGRAGRRCVHGVHTGLFHVR